MKNVSRKDDLGFTEQGMGETMITVYENRGGEVWQRHADGRRELFAADIIEKLTGLERELNQAIRERDQARSNVKPMGAVTIARNGYIQEIEAQRDQAIKERDAWFGLAQKLRDLLAPLAWLQAVTHPNRAEIAVAEFDEQAQSYITH